jgi:hypothetical protein
MFTDDEMNAMLDEMESCSAGAGGCASAVPRPRSKSPVYISASNVASALGMKPFDAGGHEFFLKMAYETQPRLRDAIEAECARVGLVNVSEVRDTLQAAVVVADGGAFDRAIVAATRAAVESKDDAGVAAAIDSAKSAAAAAAAAIGAAPAEAQILIAAAAESVTTKRGELLENKVLDDFETRTGVTVTDRNAHIRYLRTDTYLIGGRLDGFDAESKTIIEVKNRKRTRKAGYAPPDYDIVQLRCYLAILRANGEPEAKGRLLEAFPDGTNCETPVEWDDVQWGRLDAALKHLVAQLDALTVADVPSIVSKAGHADLGAPSRRGKPPRLPHEHPMTAGARERALCDICRRAIASADAAAFCAPCDFDVCSHCRGTAPPTGSAV